MGFPSERRSSLCARDRQPGLLLTGQRWGRLNTRIFDVPIWMFVTLDTLHQLGGDPRWNAEVVSVPLLIVLIEVTLLASFGFSLALGFGHRPRSVGGAFVSGRTRRRSC